MEALGVLFAGGFLLALPYGVTASNGYPSPTRTTGQGRMTAALDAYSLALVGPDERVAAVRRQRGLAPRRR